jgi:hypothetical protein
VASSSNFYVVSASKIIYSSRVGLAQLIRFLMVELTYSGLNFRFNMCVIFMANYSSSGRRCLRRQRDALVD